MFLHSVLVKKCAYHYYYNRLLYVSRYLLHIIKLHDHSLVHLKIFFFGEKKFVELQESTYVIILDECGKPFFVILNGRHVHFL